MCQFLYKTENFDFSGPNLPKMDFGVRISKLEAWIWNQHLQDTIEANFQSK